MSTGKVDLTDDEGPVLRRLHHEIHLADARRTAPEAQRTVLRRPVG